MIRNTTTVVMVLFALARIAALPARADGEAAAGPLVRILTTYQEPDPILVWQKQHPGVREGYGVRVADNRILTTEHLVRNHTLIEVQLPESGEKITARVETMDPQVNLALLTVSDPAALMETAIAPPIEAVDRSAALSILQFDQASQLQQSEGAVVEIGMTTLPHAPARALLFSVQSQTDIDGEGNPVLQQGGLAGLLMQYNRGDRTAAMLPASALRRFMEDVDTPPYQGLASAGLLWTPLVDPAKRAYLGVPEAGHGILVTTCIPGSDACRILMPNDVILEWDGHPIDTLGFYRDPDFGRLQFVYLIKGRHRPGDVIPARIVRDRTEQAVEVQLSPLPDHALLIPDNTELRPAEYLVEGGLLIRELSGDFLRAHGGDWMNKVDPRLTHLYNTRRFSPETPGDRVVILAGVLADPINIGYQRFGYQVIEAINGQPVHNMTDVFGVVDRDGHATRVSLQSMSVDLVLDRAELPAANARLAQQYRLPALRYAAPRAGATVETTP